MKFKRVDGLEDFDINNAHICVETPPAMAGSLKASAERLDKINKELGERQKLVDDFIKEEEGKKNYKIKLKEPSYKKMGLVENASRMTRKQLKESRLNEWDVNYDLWMRFKNTLTGLYEDNSFSAQEFLDCLIRFKTLFVKEYGNELEDTDESLKEGFPYGINRNVSDKLLEMVDEGVLDGYSLALACIKWMGEEDVQEMAKANEFIVEDADESLKEEKCPNCGEKDCDDSCEKELTETKHGLKEGRKKLVDTQDLWEKIYSNLATDLGNDTNHTVPDISKGCRYEKMSTDIDGNIVVYATSPDEFDFAKKVADYYQVETSDVKEDKNARTNSYYKYYMTIYVPEE